MVNVDKLRAELEGAGLSVKAISPTGRVVLADGTVCEPDGSCWHEDDASERDEARAAVVSDYLAAHDAAPTEAQEDAAWLSRAGGPLAVVALVAIDRDAAPKRALAFVEGLAAQARRA